jgi:ferredoxin
LSDCGRRRGRSHIPTTPRAWIGYHGSQRHCATTASESARRTGRHAREFPVDSIIKESFTSPRRAEVPDATQIATLVASGVSRTIEVRGGMTLLDAALDAGLSISFSCCSGGCGACHIEVIDHVGNVVLDEPNDVCAEDRSRGNLPACLARLRGPVTFILS